MNTLTKCIGSLLALIAAAGCGEEATQPQPAETWTITATDIYHHNNVVDVAKPTSQWLIDGAEEPLDLAQVWVKSPGRVATLVDWLRAGGRMIPQILHHATISIRPEEVAAGRHTTALMRAKCDCEWICDDDGCYEVCVGACIPDGTIWRCPVCD